MRMVYAAALAATFGVCGAAPAAAWGLGGHTIINSIAAAGFAQRMPAFLTTSGARFAMTYLGAQPDRLKGSGRAWDSEYDPGHFVDLNDDATIGGSVALAQLPASREAYDTALRAGGTDQYRQGYLPYSILDGWEQLRTDFGFWLLDDYAAQHATTPQVRAQELAIRAVDEQQIISDIGTWGHYIGDGSQPLHVTVHFNGWGNYPNPNAYTASHRTHSFFESTFVDKYLNAGVVAPLVPVQSSLVQPQTLLTQDEVMADVVAYLRATLAAVTPLYDIEKAHGFDNGSDAAKHFAAQRLAAGAAELRDLSVLAWQDSVHTRVGYPATNVQDVLSGKAAWPPARSNDGGADN